LEIVVPSGTAETEPESAIIGSPYLGYGRATSVVLGDGIGRHPAVPRFPIDLRSII